MHREKSFTFSDGTVWKCCTADSCGWDKTHKTHNPVAQDTYVGDDALGDLPNVEPTEDNEEVRELGATPRLREAGEEELEDPEEEDQLGAPLPCDEGVYVEDELTADTASDFSQRDGDCEL